MMSRRRIEAPMTEKLDVCVSHDGQLRYYTIFMHRSLVHLMYAEALRLGVPRMHCVFELDGRVLDAKMKPGDIGLVNDATITVRIVPVELRRSYPVILRDDENGVLKSPRIYFAKADDPLSVIFERYARERDVPLVQPYTPYFIDFRVKPGMTANQLGVIFGDNFRLVIASDDE
jgi:hypothetical protein